MFITIFAGSVGNEKLSTLILLEPIQMLEFPSLYRVNEY